MKCSQDPGSKAVCKQHLYSGLSAYRASLPPLTAEGSYRELIGQVDCWFLGSRFPCSVSADSHVGVAEMLLMFVCQALEYRKSCIRMFLLSYSQHNCPR